MRTTVVRLAFLALWLAALGSPALRAQTVQAVPASAVPGAMFVADLEGLTAGSTYRLYLERGQPFVERFLLIEFSAADTDGTKKLLVPDEAQLGAHHLVLYLGSTLMSERDRTPFTVGTPLALTLTPTSAEPGKAVQVSATGVRAGTLTVHYAGGAVLGPLAVKDGSWSGKFIVPRDRPASLPANVTVDIVNTIGKTIAQRGKASFRALAPSGLPTFRSIVSVPPPTRVTEGTRLSFAGSLKQPDDSGTNGRTSFFWRSADGRVVPVDGGVETDADGNYAESGRAPSFLMDGVGRYGSGQLLGVVQDEDPDTGAPRDFVTTTDMAFETVSDHDPGMGQFVIRLRGRLLLGGGTVPIENVFVRVYGGLEGAFTDPDDGIPPPGDGDFLVHDTQFNAEAVDAGIDVNVLTNGCPITFGSKYTDDNGEVLFELDKEKLQHLIMRQALIELGEIRTIDHGAPVPGVDVFQDQVGNPGFRKGAAGERVYLSMEIIAGPQGYGETGMIDADGNPDFPPYDYQPGIVPSYVGLSVDVATGEVFLDNGATQVQPGVFQVELPAIDPSTTANVRPYSLRIAGLPEPQRVQHVEQFVGLHAWPDTGKWPDSVFVPPFAGRQMRFAWNVGFGTADTPRLQLATNCAVGPGCTPQLQDVATFALDSASACNVVGELDYVATLPDLRRLQVGKCYYGRIRIDRSPPAMQDINLCTRAAPDGMFVGNPQIRPGTLRINPLALSYQGEFAMPASNVTGDDPNMQEYNLPPQENESMNDGGFSLRADAFGGIQGDTNASTQHIVGNNGTEGTNEFDATTFGFDGSATRGNIVRNTVLDTGRIPLFRYPWGFSPIAGAVLGADFWLGADVGFYGKFQNTAGGGTKLHATIDPSVAGGVDMFFDLDILFGVVSASISALPSIDLTLRELIGDGGLPDDQEGTCFTFDLDAELEICALFCASDRFNLFTARDGSGCPQIPFKAFRDIVRPKPVPAALAADGFGRELVVSVEPDGDLVATHLEQNAVQARRTVRARSTGVQHVTAVYLGSNKALAVWSESTLGAAQLETLMTPRLGHHPVRDGAPALARSLALRWSYFDGTAWSAPATIGGATTSVGKPQLAACKVGFNPLTQCSPRAPEAFLVYEHEAGGDLNRPNFEVWGAEFTPSAGFRAPRRLSPASGTQDLHPDAAYMGPLPVVAWVTNSGAVYGAPGTRQIAYRVIDRDLRNLPQTLAGSSGAGWPTVAGEGSDGVVLAYTRAQDASLVGNRNALTLARGRSCADGVCTFQVTEPRDTHGRQIRGEKPALHVEADGAVVVGLRALAFGPTAGGTVGLSSDPPGVLLGTGDLLEMRVSDFSRATVTVATQNRTGNGGLHLRPEFVFDPALDAFVSISQEVELPAQSAPFKFARAFAPKGFAAATHAKTVAEGGITLRSMAAVPDLRVEAFTPAVDWLAPGAGASYTVEIRNAGAAYDPAVHGTAQLLLAWDAAPGSGPSAATPYALSSPLAPNQRLVLTRSFTAPPAGQHFSDQRRRLHVELRPADPMQDANGEDNHAFALLGELPVPQDLAARTKTNAGHVGLDWSPASDPRVVGYRIYKRAENGEFVPYGSSPSSGYVDVFAGFRNTEQYRVTAYSERGIESAMSGILEVAPDQTFGLFDDGFEGNL